MSPAEPEPAKRVEVAPEQDVEKTEPAKTLVPEAHLPAVSEPVAEEKISIEPSRQEKTEAIE